MKEVAADVVAIVKRDRVKGQDIQVIHILQLPSARRKNNVVAKGRRLVVLPIVHRGPVVIGAQAGPGRYGRCEAVFERFQDQRATLTTLGSARGVVLSQTTTPGQRHDV